MTRAFSLRISCLGLVVFGLMLGINLLQRDSMALAAAEVSAVRISQIYGAGGNQGALWQADFVEIFNAGDTSVDLTGWAVEYASADGDNWRRTPLDGQTIQPYSYLLVAGAAGSGGNGSPLPPPDVAGSTNLSGSDGKVRLVDGGSAVLDLVGYGSANAFEGSGPVPALSAANAAYRNDGGCTDNNDNAADFQLLPPQPRNSASASNGCAGGTAPTFTPTPSDGSPPPDTPTPTPTDTPSTPAGTLLISEFLADPAAVDDNAGEWLEIANPGSSPVNLRNWTIRDEGSDQHVIGADLWIDPGGYVVLGRNSDPTQNGGVTLSYLYTGISLANGEDELLLIAPDQSLMDQVRWGAAAGLSVSRGASLYRSSPAQDAVWITASVPWRGSAGDFGNPGSAADGAPPTATPVPSGEPTTEPTVGPTDPVPTATPAVSPSPTPSMPTPSVTTTPGATPHRLFLSEILADSRAVNDSDGEWLEIYNAGPSGVDLVGWTLTDGGRDNHVIESTLWIEAGTYAVLARNGDAVTNGGVNAAYVYRGINLANEADEIRLLDPGGVEQDRVAWGGGAPLRIVAGASLERTTFDGVAQWQVAIVAWPGSAGDRGSPGAAYSLPPLETPTPTATPTPAVSPSPTSTPTTTPTPTPTATRPAVAWPLPEAFSPLQIEEVAFRGSDTEFIALINTGDTALDLTGWLVGDAEVPGDGEGLYALPAYVLLPNVPFVIARNGAAFQLEYGRVPDAQFEAENAVVPVLERKRELASGAFALNDSGDEVVLLDPLGRLADAVAYGDGDAVVLGLSTALTTLPGASLQRVPGFAFPATRDPRSRFLWARPDPFSVHRLPEAQPAPPLNLPDGLLGVVGTMGVSSTFSPNGFAPPHRVAWAAVEAGLHFAAIGDIDPTSMQSVANAPILTLPAWRWQGGAGDEAVIYGSYFAAGADRLALLDGLSATGASAQWIDGDAPDHPNVFVTPADGIDGAADAYRHWSASKMPLLAGNTLPALPGYLDPSPRYTGLAVDSANADAILAAMRARRGWLTSNPNVSLTLRTESGVWMGGIVPLTGQISFVINYQDRSGDVAGLALWQDGKPLRQLDLPPMDGEWRVTVPVAPNSLIYAVATQVDGDFAVTMPLRVTGNGNARIWINEVMPVPLSDHNRDGVADTGDEYIELWNAGPDPISLAGWQLADRPDSEPAQRRLFTLGPQHFLDAGAYLVIWGKESFIGLTNSNERLALFDPGGQLVDFVEWSSSPGGDRTLSRVPDGGRWDLWGSSPGWSNGDYSLVVPPTPTPPAWQVAGSAAPGTPGGEAVGPFGSVTQAKLAGMGESVRFVGVVTAPPGLFNAAIYVADPAGGPNEATAAVGVQVYLNRGDFPPLAEGDRIDVQGVMDSFRGEREIRVARPELIWRVDSGAPLLPLPVNAADIGEKLEGRLVTFEGIVTGFRGSSFFLADPANPEAAPVEVHVRSSLPWRRPFVVDGDRWRVTGIVGQFALEAPWNGGYRVLARYEGDLVRLKRGTEPGG